MGQWLVKFAFIHYKAKLILGTDPLIKKFPETTTIQLFKNVMSKLFKIPIAELKIFHRAPSNEVNFNFTNN